MNWKPVRWFFGVLLIVLGIAGLFLPFLQGILLILAGLALLGNKRVKEWAHELKARVQRKRL